jgi:hypothetical protein
MGGNMIRSILLVCALDVCLSLLASCTGGCWLEADDVRVEPATDCLVLYAGSADTHRVCAVAQLGGVNNCSEALTLPPLSATDKAVVVAPGGKVAWWLPTEAVPPAVTTTQVGYGPTNYVIRAALGDQSITITVPIHPI